jgi:hypothetical protein
MVGKAIFVVDVLAVWYEIDQADFIARLSLNYNAPL